MAFIFCHHPCWFYLFRYMSLLLCIQLSTGVKLKNKSIQNLWSQLSSSDTSIDFCTYLVVLTKFIKPNEIESLLRKTDYFMHQLSRNNNKYYPLKELKGARKSCEEIWYSTTSCWPSSINGGRNREKIRFEGNKIGCTAYNHEQKHHMTVSLV